MISDCLGTVTAIQGRKNNNSLPSKSAIKIIILLVTLKRGKLKERIEALPLPLNNVTNLLDRG